MAHITADRVRDTSTTTSTGSLTVSGTAPTGYRTFSAVSSTNDTFYYALQHQTADEWEVGLGTYSGTNTIARTTILASSNAGSVVNLSAGTKDVFITFPAALFDGEKLKVANGGTGAATLTANNVLLGNGTSAVQAVAPGSSGNVLTSNGTTWTSAAPSSGGSIDVQTFTSSGTWTKPSGYASGSRVLVQAWGGGGSGGRHATATSVGGGGGGGYNEAWLTLSQFGATETITIGAGGASRTGSNQVGAAGGNTTVGSLLTAYGGGGGCSSNNSAGGGGGGQLSAGSNGTGSAPSNPGTPFIVAHDTDGSLSYQIRQGSGNQSSPAIASSNLAAFWHGGGGGAASSTVSYNAGCASVWGGGGGAGHNTGTGGTSSFGGNGGASGATGTAGSQPGGGGGGGTSTSGAGGDGKVIITVFPA